MSEELNPCPFTGEKPVFSMWTPSDGRRQGYAAGVWVARIASSEISIEKSSRDGEDDAKSAAIAAWNTRATLSPAHIEDGEEVEVVATVCCSKDGDWYVDALHPSRVGEKGYLVEGDELMTVAQHQRIVAARASKAAARIEDEREEFERRYPYVKGLGFDGERYVKLNDGAWQVIAEVEANLQWNAWQARAALSAPPAAGTTSDQYRAELYDEVWQKARDMGYGNVTDALVELERIKAAPPAAGVPEECHECKGSGEVYGVSGDGPWSCYACSSNQEPVGYANFGELDNMLNDRTATVSPIKNGWYGVALYRAAPTPPASEQQHDGRMPSDSRNRMWELIDAALLGTVPDGLKRGDICNILAPLFASEQQRAVGLDVIDKLRLELLPEYEAGYTAIAYGDSDQPVARADGMTAREAIAELLRLNPHLAKCEGV